MARQTVGPARPSELMKRSCNTSSMPAATSKPEKRLLIHPVRFGCPDVAVKVPTTSCETGVHRYASYPAMRCLIWSVPAVWTGVPAGVVASNGASRIEASEV